MLQSRHDRLDTCCRNLVSSLEGVETQGRTSLLALKAELSAGTYSDPDTARQALDTFSQVSHRPTNTNEPVMPRSSTCLMEHVSATQWLLAWCRIVRRLSVCLLIAYFQSAFDCAVSCNQTQNAAYRMWLRLHKPLRPLRQASEQLKGEQSCWHACSTNTQSRLQSSPSCSCTCKT